MNIIRGSGLSGLKGIDAIRKDIIRPILCLERKEIENYCKACNLSFVTDSTNKETVYTRNKIRLKLIKEIDDMFNVDITRKINQMSDLVREDNNFIETSAEEAFLNCTQEESDLEICLNLEKLKIFHKAIQKRVLRKAIGQIKKDINSIENKHIESICNLIEGEKTGQEIDLPKEIKAYRDYNMLRIYKKEQEKEEIEEINVKDLSNVEVNGECMLNMELVEQIDKDVNKDEYTKYFDYDKLKSGFTIRNRRDGDIFKPLNSNGKKKLKKYFIDNKVSKLQRDRFYLVAQGSEIVWIVGDKVSDNFKVTNKTKNIVRLKFIPRRTK